MVTSGDYLTLPYLTVDCTLSGVQDTLPDSIPTESLLPHFLERMQGFLKSRGRSGTAHAWGCQTGRLSIAA